MPMETAAYTVGAVAIVVIGVLSIVVIAWKRGIRRKLMRRKRKREARDLRYMPKATAEEIEEYMGRR